MIFFPSAHWKIVFIVPLLAANPLQLFTQEVHQSYVIENYVPVDKELYQTIVAMDQTYFDAYNSCDMKIQAELYSEDLEFYHDLGGLNTSKEEVLEAIENNICGKVTRTLVEGSIEVYPIKDYGAVEMGYHTFTNHQEGDTVSKPGRFVMLWKKEGIDWKIARVISLH